MELLFLYRKVLSSFVICKGVFIMLETDRVIIRRFTIEDAKDMFNNWTSDKDINKYMLWDLHCTIDDSIKTIEFYIKCYENNSSYIMFAIVDKISNEVIGSISYNLNRRHDYASIGYLLCKKMQNKGIMTEAINVFTNYLFNELKCNRIEAEVIKDNIPSIKLLEKCGFKEEGLIRSKYYINNKYNDVYVYGKIRDEKNI